jgi:hypothetical protein
LAAFLQLVAPAELFLTVAQSSLPQPHGSKDKFSWRRRTGLSVVTA